MADHLSRRRRHRRHLHRHRAARLRRRHPHQEDLLERRQLRAAIVEGLAEVFARPASSGAAIEEIRHGTTVASNAILEHKGARGRPDHHQGLPRRAGDPHAAHAAPLRHRPGRSRAPLVERYLRQVVDERIDHRGPRRARARSGRRRARGRRAARREGRGDRRLPDQLVRQSGARADAARRSSQRKAPRLPVSISFEVLPEIKEYERTSTTVINAYVMPIVATYLARAAQGPRRRRHPGAAAADAVERRADHRHGRRRAADEHHRVRPGRRRGRRAGAGAREGSRRRSSPSTWAAPPPRPRWSRTARSTRAQEYAVGAGIMIGSRLLTGAGYTLKVPAIDLAEVGAGGGSHVWIDAGGALQVGPESAGALPGPGLLRPGRRDADHHRRQRHPRLHQPRHLVGGALKLNADEGARGVRGRRSPSRSACASSTPPTART